MDKVVRIKVIEVAARFNIINNVTGQDGEIGFSFAMQYVCVSNEIAEILVKVVEHRRVSHGSCRKSFPCNTAAKCSIFLSRAMVAVQVRSLPDTMAVEPRLGWMH